jgi:16S rRNA (guanine527-N7)-methyltransferase
VPDTDEGRIDPELLREVLVAARQAGFLGPGPIERHLLHAQGFVTLARGQASGEQAHILDLGSGGGLPGLIVAGEMPETTLVLLEANERRAQFLDRAVVTCGIESRVRVVHERAEVAGRDPAYRGSFHGVVVRSFGPPAVVAECSAPVLRVGGWLIVSEPPTEPGVAGATEETGRWPADQLAQLGLRPEEFVRTEFGYQVVRQISPCPDQFPRRNGIPAKRPLF